MMSCMNCLVVARDVCDGYTHPLNIHDLKLFGCPERKNVCVCKRERENNGEKKDR